MCFFFTFLGKRDSVHFPLSACFTLAVHFTTRTAHAFNKLAFYQGVNIGVIQMTKYTIEQSKHIQTVSVKFPKLHEDRSSNKYELANSCRH